MLGVAKKGSSAIDGARKTKFVSLDEVAYGVYNRVGFAEITSIVAMHNSIFSGMEGVYRKV